MERRSPVTLVTGIWLLLVALTIVTFTVGELRLAGPVVVALVLATAFTKGQLVVDHFMGLRRAPWRWRALLFGWLLGVVALVSLAYLRGMN